MLLTPFRWSFTVVAVAAATVVVGASLEWPPSTDATWMMYLARMSDVGGLTPYREIWDLHPPGAFAAYVAAGTAFGYSPEGARIADLFLMVVLLASTWRWVSPHGRQAAVAAVACAALVHTRGTYILQREVFAFSPLLAALALLATAATPATWHLVAVGAAFGWGATIKPHMVIGLPWVAVWVWRHGPPVWRASFAPLGWLLAGAAAPPVLALGYLVATNSLAPFVDMALHFWPAYAAIKGSTWADASLAGALGSTLASFASANHIRWVPAAVAGAWMAWQGADDRGRSALTLMGGIAASYIGYVGVQGHFMWSHWFPFLYLAVPLACLSLASCGRRAPILRQGVVLGLLFLVAGIEIRLPDPFLRQLVLGHPMSVEKIESRRMADALVERGGEARRVQALDWVWAGPSLRAGARSASSFISDVPFWGYAHNQYGRDLRRRMLQEFDADPPELIICPRFPRAATYTPTPLVAPAFRERLRDGYHLVEFTPNILLYERNDLHAP